MRKDGISIYIVNNTSKKSVVLETLQMFRKELSDEERYRI